MLAWTQDTTAALIVIGGTLCATVLRCGLADARQTLRMIAASLRGHFNDAAMRGGLAPQVQQFNLDGLVRARPLPTGDRAIDAALAVLVAQRSVAAMRAAHDGARGDRIAAAATAVRTLAQAAELAPVAGLAATLVALARLPAGIAHGMALDAIGMAVHATLIGLVFAHLVLVPLAAWVDRRALAAEAARDAVVAWLATQLAHAAPGATPVRPPVPRAGPIETIDLPMRLPRFASGFAAQAVAEGDEGAPVPASEPVSTPDGAPAGRSAGAWPGPAVGGDEAVPLPAPMRDRPDEAAEGAAIAAPWLTPYLAPAGGAPRLHAAGGGE